MRITVEDAARAVSEWMGHPDTDPDEIAEVYQHTFAAVKEACLNDVTGDIDVTPEIDFSEEELVREMREYHIVPVIVQPVPDLCDWPESLTDEIMLDYGIGIETLRKADDPLALVVAAGMDEDTIRERIEVDHIRTQKRCAG